MNGRRDEQRSLTVTTAPLHEKFLRNAFKIFFLSSSSSSPSTRVMDLRPFRC